MRGWHACPLCPRSAGTDPVPYPLVISDPRGDFPVGHGEIRVLGPSGRRYAAPEMIIHYVEEHGYRPPQDFVDGVPMSAISWMHDAVRRNATLC